jgi:two-component system chemotaxis response regulator CheB
MPEPDRIQSTADRGRSTAEPAYVIALVASSGGLDAVSTILRAVPSNLAAAIVVLLHQDPDRVSTLVEILDRRSTMPVSVAVDAQRLESGVVVVIPPGSHALVKPGAEIMLISSGAFPPSRPSADLLLATLATAAGKNAIAVVLSGLGHDAATGATAIHSAGGVVIASDQATSDQFAMPQATISRPRTIDHTVALESIAQLLAALTTTPATSP